MRSHGQRARAAFTVVSCLSGFAMIVLALNIQIALLSAQETGGCGTAEVPTCEAGQACCSGVCFDPMTDTCSCDGEVVPLPTE